MGDIATIVAGCLAAYRRRLEWDAAFDLVDRYGAAGDLETLFADALDQLLNAARLATVETWISRSEERQLSSSTIEVAKAELALRDGKHLSAQTFAQTALTLAGENRSEARRAAMAAGRAAHTGSREESALEFYRMAEQFAASARDKRDALWGQLMAASALEMNEARDILDVLESTADQTDRYEIVRMADKKLGAGTRAGSVGNLANARRVVELVDHVHDPFARCSFRCNYAYSLDLSSFYEDAHEQALLVLADAADFRVDPALPYAHYVLAIALAGLGRYSDAHRELDNAVRESRRCSDDFGLQNAFAGRMRVLVQEGRAAEACAIEPPDLSGSLRSMRGEVLASRGLALVTLGRLAEAKSLASNAASATTSVETRVLVAAVEAICAMRERAADWRGNVERLVDTAFDADGVDLLVAAYRGNADLLDALLGTPRHEGADDLRACACWRSGPRRGGWN